MGASFSLFRTTSRVSCHSTKDNVYTCKNTLVTEKNMFHCFIKHSISDSKLVLHKRDANFGVNQLLVLPSLAVLIVGLCRHTVKLAYREHWTFLCGRIHCIYSYKVIIDTSNSPYQGCLSYILCIYLPTFFSSVQCKLYTCEV